MTTWISLVTGGAGALVVMAAGLYQFSRNKLHSDGEFQRVVRALETEQEAHARTRETLAVANARADAGLKPAELIAAVISSQQRSISQ